MDWFAKSEKDRVRTEQRDRTDDHRERRGFAFIAAAFDDHRCISTVDRCRFTERAEYGRISREKEEEARPLLRRRWPNALTR
jgi:hypothetical protein